MGIIALMLIIAVIALIVYASDRWLPGRAIFKQIIFWIGIIGVIWLIGNAFGVWAYIHDVPLPRLHH